MVRILVATDAWHPQVNGVVRTLTQTAHAAARAGAEIRFVAPDAFRTVPMPSYGEIRLALASASAITRRIEADKPDYVHIATEGPVGIAARTACRRLGRPFTTSYHTRFPEYLRARLPVPLALSYAALRRFHNASAGIMVSTDGIQRELEMRGFRRLMRWSRGVDHELFRPRRTSVFDLPRPIFLYVGRVAVEKNIEAFLRLDLPGSKVVIGDGPSRASLQRDWPDVHFTGMLEGEALAEAYASGDVFVFPSLTDTFGVVLLEAMASGLPVAAYPVAGPLDVVGDSGAGVLDTDLRRAALACLSLDRELCRSHALTFSWEASARQFLDNVVSAAAAAPTGHGSG